MIGDLDFQIEHHLVPALPTPSTRYWPDAGTTGRALKWQMQQGRVYGDLSGAGSSVPSMRCSEPRLRSLQKESDVTAEWSKPSQSPTFVSARPRPTLLIGVSTAGDTCVVRVRGELDFATRNQLVSASTASNHPAIVIELGGVTFMDCSGYSALVTSRVVIESEGRSVTIKGQTGQTARLIDLIAELESAHSDRATPVSVGWSG